MTKPDSCLVVPRHHLDLHDQRGYMAMHPIAKFGFRVWHYLVKNNFRQGKHFTNQKGISTIIDTLCFYGLPSMTWDELLYILLLRVPARRSL